MHQLFCFCKKHTNVRKNVDLPKIFTTCKRYFKLISEVFYRQIHEKKSGNHIFDFPIG